MLLREEVRAVLAKQATLRARTTATLWRGAEAGKTALWIARLDDQEHLLVHKVRGRFHTVVGVRDDVLASVPDAHMESAVNAVIPHGLADAHPSTPREMPHAPGSAVVP